MSTITPKRHLSAVAYGQTGRYARALRELRNKICRADWPDAATIAATVMSARAFHYNALTAAFPDPAGIVSVEHLRDALRCLFAPSKIRD